MIEANSRLDNALANVRQICVASLPKNEAIPENGNYIAR